LPHDQVDGPAVPDINLQQSKRAVTLGVRQVGPLAGLRVEGVEVIHHNDRLTGSEQAVDQGGADESGASGHKVSHAYSPYHKTTWCWANAWNGEASGTEFTNSQATAVAAPRPIP